MLKSSHDDSFPDSVVDRIVSLVGTRTNGVWSTQIDVEYERKFKGEKLPDKWPDKIESSCYGKLKLRVDRPIPDRCIILPNLQPQQQLSVDVRAAAAAAENSSSPSPAHSPFGHDGSRVIQRCAAPLY